jgi:hypothetical protein
LVEVPTLLDGLFLHPHDKTKPVAKIAVQGAAAAGAISSSSSSSSSLKEAAPGMASATPPDEFWSYVFPPTRSGLLPALGALQRRSSSSLGYAIVGGGGGVAGQGKSTTVMQRFEAAPADLKDALVAFLSREPARELADEDAALAARLPIWRAFEPNPAFRLSLEQGRGDGEAAAGAGVMAAAAVAAPSIAPTTTAAVRAMVATAFVCLLGEGEKRCFVLAEATDADHDVLTKAFLGPKDRAEEELCVRCGAVPLPRRAFFQQHVFPRLAYGSGLPPLSGDGSDGSAVSSSSSPKPFPSAAVRDACLLAMLLETPRLCDRASGGDPSFADVLRRTPFVPVRDAVVGANDDDDDEEERDGEIAETGKEAGARGLQQQQPHHRLSAPASLFDPDVHELRGLVDPSTLPATPFDSPRALVALRGLGLQSALSWPGIVQCAQAVAQHASTSPSSSSSLSIAPTPLKKAQQQQKRAVVRGKKLLAFIDVHHARLFGVEERAKAKEKRSGLLGWAVSAVGLNAGEQEALARADAERAEHLDTLSRVAWLPVAPNPPELYLPWPSSSRLTSSKNDGDDDDDDSGNSEDLFPTLVAPPREVRPTRHMWLCSHRYFGLAPDCTLSSPELAQAFGWDAPLPSVLAATQLRMVAEKYESLCLAVGPTGESKDGNKGGSGESGTSGGSGPTVNTSSTVTPADQTQMRSVEDLQRQMASVVPRLYATLDSIGGGGSSSSSREGSGSGAHDDHEKQKQQRAEVVALREALNGRRWLWMGTRFVSSDQVAFTTPANAAPYLYAVPPDLACFGTLLRTFGVRKTFGTSDWVAVLRQMAVETFVVTTAAEGAGAAAAAASASSIKTARGLGAEAVAVAGAATGIGGGGGVVVAKPLSATQLELALSLVQVLSDDTMQVADMEVFCPDDANVLAPASELVYNDAPWLARGGGGSSRGGGSGTAGGAGAVGISVGGGGGGVASDVRFVHPKISSGVGERVGIRSLRLLLASTHATSMDFGIQSESFGQSESITRRLRHILELYPEGPSILSELIQNGK